MPLKEDPRSAADRANNHPHAGVDDVESLLLPDQKPSAFKFRDDGKTPNNPRFPLLLYRAPLSLKSELDPATVFEELFARNGWVNSWRDGIYNFLHFHTRSHEVLAIARGSALVRFGGGHGRTMPIKRGDVIVLPAGTGHQRMDESRDLLVVGAYPKGSKYDEPRPHEVEPEAARSAIASVPPPPCDPVYGPNGPLVAIWKSRFFRTGNVGSGGRV